MHQPVRPTAIHAQRLKDAVPTNEPFVGDRDRGFSDRHELPI
jgi:hypothetical protein